MWISGLGVNITILDKQGLEPQDSSLGVKIAEIVPDDGHAE